MIVEIVAISLIAFIVNIPLGIWRTRYKRLSINWWLLIHASVPFIVVLRIYLETPNLCIPLFIGMAILGQLLGVRFARRKADSYE